MGEQGKLGIKYKPAHREACLGIVNNGPDESVGSHCDSLTFNKDL